MTDNDTGIMTLASKPTLWKLDRRTFVVMFDGIDAGASLRNLCREETSPKSYSEPRG